jgi:hypothetical protein
MMMNRRSTSRLSFFVDLMQDWAMGGGCTGTVDVLKDLPLRHQTKRAFTVKKDTLSTGTVKGLYELTDQKIDEFVRFEVNTVFFSDVLTTKAAILETPSLKYRTDFNLFEKDGGTEVMRHTYDFEQQGSAFIPVFMGSEVSEENSAMAAAWSMK